MRIVSALLLLIATSFSTLAHARELHWERLDVKAQLDAGGRLHVEETQRMVFTGDWNGGERTFDIRPRQELTFTGMARVDASGAEIPMTQGSLNEVDEWDWASPHVLRWRSRNANDPTFLATPLTYVLRYTLSNVLVRDDDQYVLDHDFAFAKRDGDIEHFRLDLTLDPVWQPSGPLQKTWTVDGIPPGKSFVLTVPLRFTGSEVPEADDGLAPEMRWMLIAMAGVPLLLFAYAMAREQLLGRLDAAPEITRGWLEQHLLRERAEVIGAMWDEDVGGAEVSAALARMTAEGRLESKVVDGEMDLTIVSRKDLDDYEQALLDGLFFRGNHTSTAKIRSHYSESGFDPAALLRPGLMAAARERLPHGAPVTPWRTSRLFLALAIVAFGAAVYTHGDWMIHSILLLIGASFVSFLCNLGPHIWRSRKSLGIRSAMASLIPATIVTSIVAYFMWRSAAKGSPELPQEMQLGISLLAIWIAACAIHALRSKESRESIAFRKQLGAARDYFKRELQKAHPAIDDAWYPYVLAFGLDHEMNRWVRVFPGASDDRESTSTSYSSSASSSSSSSSGSAWTGGGGAFGGAGASGMWAAAATGMAAGVSPPSSSSDSGSSSSSSSSGGSSGGGGGGGW